MKISLKVRKYLYICQNLYNMKKTLLSLVAMATVAFTAQAQDSKSFGFSKGDILLEGNLTLSTENNKEEEFKTTNFNFSPKAGYFFTNKFAAGIELGIGTKKNDDYHTNVINKQNSFKAGVFGRYYFLELGKRFKVYGEANLGLHNTKYTVDYPRYEEEAKYKGMYTGAGLGLNYFVAKNFAINFALSNVISYSTSKGDWHGAKATNNFDANINVFNNFFETAQFGLTYKF